ncbi:MAG: APC family permease [Thermodesulfobacteriota bacterium]|nr:APC family permease [Thermodesulfobacteriota bacterium]
MAITGLKRVLGLKEVVFIAIGFTIGGGVFVFTGIVLKITGPALPLAYGLAVIPVFITMMPLAMLGSAIPSTGGNYKYPSRMVSPGLAFTGIWTYALASFFGQIPLYAIACANYAKAFAPGLSIEIFAIGLLTLFFIINLFGVRLAAQVQGVMVIILVAALFFYFGKGLTILTPEHFDGFFQEGISSLTLGVALLTFTYFGSNGIIELGGEIKNPGRVIPRALFIAFPVITTLYILVSIATVGALPWQTLTNSAEPLIAASKCLLGRFGFAFFIAGGAILALTTTLNALFIVATKSLLVIIDDGILPNRLGRLNKRFGTAHILLTIIWGLSILGVLSRFSLETFASYAALGGMIIFFPVLLASLILPRRYPDRYRNSEFKLKGIWFWLCPFVGFIMVVFFSAIIIFDLKSPLKIILFFVFISSGVLIYQLRKRHLLKQGIDLSDIKKQEDWIE